MDYYAAVAYVLGRITAFARPSVRPSVRLSGNNHNNNNNNTVFIFQRRFGLVGNVVGRINEVNQRRARLVLGWVTVCRRVNHLGM